MGKNKKRKPKQNFAKPNQAQRTKGPNYPLIAMGIGCGLIVLVGAYFLLQKSRPKNLSASQPTQVATAKPQETKQVAATNLQETRPTLPPQMFAGKVRRAYQIAREIPEVLDKLYCYCRCRENFNHKNLLSCYVDKHAST